MVTEQVNDASVSSEEYSPIAPEATSTTATETTAQGLAAVLSSMASAPEADVPVESVAAEEPAAVVEAEPAMPQAAAEPEQAAPEPSPDLTAIIDGCHAELRGFIQLSARLAAGGEAPESIAASASTIYDYLMLSLPIHMADEDFSIAPRLRTAGAPDGVQQALEVLARQHSDIQAMIGRMASIWRAIADQPERLPELAARLSSGTERLSMVLEAHLALEENTVLPAIEQVLTAEARALIAEEMRLKPSSR